MILPTFIVVGAPRCGTTSLHYYLQQHPQICMSAIKEPNFFLFGSSGEAFIDEHPILRKSVRTMADYSQLFRRAAHHVAVGEVSPLYLYVREAAQQIMLTCGVVQVLCLLRSPAERAWSHFLHAFPDYSGGPATDLFVELVRDEMARGPTYSPYRTRTHLLRLGLYDEQVDRYRATFGVDHVMVLLTDDLEQRPTATLAAAAEFVGAAPGHEFTAAKRYNLSGEPPQGLIGSARRSFARCNRPSKRCCPRRPPVASGACGSRSTTERCGPPRRSTRRPATSSTTGAATTSSA